MNNTKEIKYNGYTAQPSDYESTDGDLALAVGVVHEDGALHPLMAPRVLACFGQHVERVFIHNNNNFSHYIVVLKDDDDNKNFAFYDAVDFGNVSDVFLNISGEEDIVDISAVGNTLVVSSSKKMYYLLWKDDGYRMLGNEVPGMEVAFALQGEVMSHTYTDKNISSAESATTTADEGWETIAQVSYKFEDVRASSFSDYQDLDTAITLKKNTNYALSTAFTNDRGAYTWYLEGVREDDAQYHVIFHGAPRKTSKHYTITTRYGYSKLRIRVYNNYSGNSQHETFSNVLVIEEGNTTSVTLKYTIKNNSDNFAALMGIANSFANKYATQKGKFIFPFFVRYALKFFDGSYARISEPILMIPNSAPVPLLHFFPHPQDESNTDVTAYAFICSLQMRIANSIGSEWEDIIKGIDIFVSQPIYTYKQGRNYDSSDDAIFTYKVFDADADINELQGLDCGNLRLCYGGTPVDEYYSHRDLYDALTRFYAFADTSTSNQWRCVQVAPMSDEQIRKNIIETSNYYRVKSMNFEDMGKMADFADIELADGALENLVNRMALDDEMLANRTLMSAHMYAYNNRMHAFDAAFRLPTPRHIILDNAFVSPNGMSCCYTYVFLHTTEGTKVVCHQASSDIEGAFNRYGLTWFFYPDNNAYRVLFISRDKSMYLDLPLTTHDFLNGAYWLADSLNEQFAPHIYGNEFQVSTAKSNEPSTQDMGIISMPYPVPDVDDCIHAPAEIYVSEVNNVFAFRSSMAVSVGCCRVMALAAAAKPMSTGQFGQFPLYAFTDAGVWSLETAQNGAYVARQPITRDVCVNPMSICQMDSSVLFASDRGIMELAGAAANCITDEVDTQFPFNCESGLQQFDELVAIFNHLIGENGRTIDADDVSVLPFKDFAKECSIMYDYVHQRVIFYNPNVRYAYVFSRLSSHWGMMLSSSVLNVNAYPSAQAIDADGNLVDFGDTDEERVPILMVTRPFALGLPDVHKTIDTIIQRGFFRNGGFGQVLYASNDMFHWFMVAQSADMFLGGFSGSAYKYFRLAIVGDVAKDESIYGCSVSYRTKLDNKLR